MRKLFFAFTQYHLLNAVNIRLSLFGNFDADLIVYSPQKVGTNQIVSRLIDMKVFDRVLAVDNYNPQARGMLKSYYRMKEQCKAAINIKEIREFVESFDYDEFFTYGSNMEAYIALDIISKKNRVVYNWYEEGTGTYRNTFYNQLPSYCNITMKLLGINIPLLPDYVWLNTPEMLTIAYPSSVKIRKLPQICNVNMINKIWGYSSESQLSDCRTVFFNQPEFDNEIQQKIIGLFQKKELLVKLHPRTVNRKLFEDYNIIKDNNIMWEIYCLNDPSLEHRVFVSKFSTACMTPKMICGIEPVIIFTQYLFQEKENDIYESMINILRESYSDKSRIYIPKSFDELSKIISQLGV